MAKMERDTGRSYALCTSADMELMEERIEGVVEYWLGKIDAQEYVKRMDNAIRIK